MLREIMSNTPQEITKEIRGLMDKLDTAHVYYTLRQLNVRYLTDNQINAVKAFIILKEHKIVTVSTILLGAILDMNQRNIVDLCHRLGDKHVITLLANCNQRDAYKYKLSDEFNEHYYGTQNKKI